MLPVRVGTAVARADEAPTPVEVRPIAPRSETGAAIDGVRERALTPTAASAAPRPPATAPTSRITPPRNPLYL